MKKKYTKSWMLLIVSSFILNFFCLNLYAGLNERLLYPEMRANSSQYEWIENVQIGSFENLSGSDGGYADFTSKGIDVGVGESLNIKLTPGFSSGSYSEYWNVWIDFNQDGDFSDSGEAVFSRSGSVSVGGEIVVPSTALKGNTRLRIAMKYGSYADISGEGTYDYGEVEDYAFIISGDPEPQPVPVIFKDINVDQAYRMIKEHTNDPDFIVLDVRTKSEYDQGHIVNSILMDYYSSEFTALLKKLDRNRTYVVYCKSGNRSKKVHSMMKDAGFKEAYNMLGGITEWSAKGYPLIK